MLQYMEKFTIMESVQSGYVMSYVNFFIPLNFVTGLFGVNVGGIPGQNMAGFTFAVVSLIAVGFILALIFKRLKWY